MLAQDKNKKESHANLPTNDFATMVILSQLYLFIFYLSFIYLQKINK
jgi:hypothetical protein